MSVFGNIVSAIFGSKHAASVTAAAGSRGLFVGQCAINVSPWATAVADFADDPIGSQLA